MGFTGGPAPASPKKSRLSSFHMGKGGLAAFTGLLVVAFVIVVGLVIANSTIFAATDIKVTGSEHVSQEVAEQLIDLPPHTTLWTVDEDAIVDDLMKSPWVNGVEVERDYPHTLKIKPRERKVAAIVYLAADDIAWAIGDDGCWIAPLSLVAAVDASGAMVNTSVEGLQVAPPQIKDPASAEGNAEADPAAASKEGAAEDGQAAPAQDKGEGEEGVSGSDGPDAQPVTDDKGNTVVSGLAAAQVIAHHLNSLLLTDLSTSINPASGKPVSNESIMAGLEYAKGFSPDFLATIKDLSIPSPEAISANLTSGVEVALGEPKNIKNKERVVTTLLSQESGVTYINVRTPDEYTFRRVPQD